MRAELTGRRKLSEFVTNHVFGNENRDVNFAVMHGDGTTNKFWCNGACTRPGLDDGTILATQGIHLLGKFEIYKWSLFQ